jgi:PKD repeat protein
MRIPKTFYVLFAVALVVGLLPLTVAARPATQAPIEADLLAQLKDGPVNFFVRMSAQADLSAAYGMDWNARGQYVYDSLREVARVTQAPVVDYATRHHLDYTSFFSGNEVYIRGGELTAAQDLAAIPGVAELYPERIHYLDPPASTDGLPEATKAWGVTDINADDVWALGYKGAGMVVANIDTGVDSTHVALNPSYKCGSGDDSKCWLDPDTQNCTPPGGAPCDTIYSGIYHGTHTMGTMVGDDDPSLTYNVGMAPDAKWIACLGCPLGSCPEYDLNTCADWIVAPGGDPNARPNVVNNSWGGTPDGDPWYLAKVNAWRAAGIFPAFSAGNSGPTCNSLGDPGAYQESFASAAHASSRTIASFSSRGNSAFGHDPYTKPNISAPGVSVTSCKPGNAWTTMDGTSMASPHTAGAVALIWSACPSYVGQIDSTFQLLQNNTDTAPAGTCGAPPDGQGNYTYGYGYLNALKAVQACATTCDPVANAAFTWTPASPYVGDVVTFNGSADGTTPITYAWTFGDGGTGSGQSVTHTYTIAGTYTVTMVATNACGTQTVTHDITVQTAPTNSLHINALALTYTGTSPYKLTATITIHDQAHAKANGVTVYGTWTLPNGRTVSRTAVTNLQGKAKIPVSGKAGTYQLCVTNLVKTGYTYNSAGNEVPACQTITVP